MSDDKDFIQRTATCIFSCQINIKALGAWKQKISLSDRFMTGRGLTKAILLHVQQTIYII